MNTRLCKLSVFSVTLGVACVEEEVPGVVSLGSEASLPVALLDSAWPVRLADDALRAPFESGAGWGAYFQRDHAAALEAFVADGDGLGVQRVHADLAALYEQAALLAAHATEHAYGTGVQAGDPAETAYVVAVARGVKGECGEAGDALAGFTPDAGLAAPAAELRAWVSAGCGAVDGLASLPAPGALGPVSVGVDPVVETLPHYTFAEQTPEALAVEVGDPAALAQRAAWHRAAALEAGAAPAVLDQVLAPWTVAAPDGAASLNEVEDGWLFGGFALSAADLAFLQDARQNGLAAVAAWAPTSLLAAALSPAVVDGTVDPQRVLEEALVVRKALSDAMVAKSGGKKGFHDPFAKLGQLAVLRAGMVLADGNDQYRDAGILRINSLELSEGPGAGDPVFSVSVAAWDVGNRNPLRAQEIMHRLVGAYPALGAARYPLDAMHIRLSRNAAPAIPVH